MARHRSPPGASSSQEEDGARGHPAAGMLGTRGHLRTPDLPAGNQLNPSKPRKVPAQALLLVPEDRPGGSSATPQRAPKPRLRGTDSASPHCSPTCQTSSVLGHLLRYFRACV